MRILPAAITMTSLLLLSGCITHETAKQDAAIALEATSQFEIEYNSAQAAQAEHQWGDRYTAANLFQQAHDADHSIKNRFNLANAYNSIGKSDIALGMFSDLVRDGQFVELTEVFPYNDGPQHVRRFNVADESQRRIAGIMAQGPGPTSAAVEGTGNSNQEARQMDLAHENAHSLMAPSALAAIDENNRSVFETRAPGFPPSR